MKSHDLLRRFCELRATIEEERAAILNRLSELDEQLRALGINTADAFYGPRTPTGRFRNSMSLRKAVITVLQKGPMTKDEIHEAVCASGYNFTTADPMNSLGVVLYGRDPKFERIGPRFALPKDVFARG